MSQIPEAQTPIFANFPRHRGRHGGHHVCGLRRVSLPGHDLRRQARVFHPPQPGERRDRPEEKKPPVGFQRSSERLCGFCLVFFLRQELLAHGISNTVSSFFTCFPSSATLATTNILESAGGHTQVQNALDDFSKRGGFQSEATFERCPPQLSGLFTSLVVLIVLLLIGPLFYFLPKVRSCYISLTGAKRRHSGDRSPSLSSLHRRFWRASTSPASGRCSCSSRSYLSCGKSARSTL